jgi:hypothetical protein
LSLRSVTHTLILRFLQFSQALVTALRFLHMGSGACGGSGGSWDRGRSGRKDVVLGLEAIAEHKTLNRDWLPRRKINNFQLERVLKVSKASTIL